MVEVASEGSSKPYENRNYVFRRLVGFRVQGLGRPNSELTGPKRRSAAKTHT